ncbi:MAG: glycine cleavage system aminomethyltransferase GcvT [Pseudomonadota bacterium]
MKHLTLENLHRKLGAKFGDFAGYEMPLFYTAGIIREHENTRKNAGLFDISHMVMVEFEGPGAASLISRLCPYPAEDQEIGRSRYCYFLNEQAGIIDDVIITRLGETRYTIVCNAGCAEKDLAHIHAQAKDFDCKVTVLDRNLLALQGPAAESVLEKCGLDVSGLSFLQVAETEEGWMIARSGYTGEDGFEIALRPQDAEKFAEKILEDTRVLPVGLGARDSLRLEAGLPLYGQDLSEDISPMEAGIAWAIPKSHREGGNFIGAEALAEKFIEGRKRKRIGLKPIGNAPVRAHARLVDQGGHAIGEVTSGGFGPTAGHPVALGLIAVDHEGPILAELRGRQIEMETAKLPFVEHRYKR